MELINGITAFLSDKQLSVPLGEVILLIIVNSFCLLFGRFKLGLLVSYCFVFYWGFIFNKSFFINLLGQTTWGLSLYIFAGLAMFITVVLGYLQHKD